MNGRVVWWIVAAWLCAAGVVVAQEEEAPDPLVFLHACQTAYVDGPIADEVEVEVRTPDGRTRRDRFTVRLDADPTGVRRLLLELGRLRVYGERDLVVAEHTGDSTACVVWTGRGAVDPELLGEFLPPLPLVELSLATSGVDVTRWLTPYTPRVVWTGAEIVGDEAVVLRGRLDASVGGVGGTIELVCDQRTDRVRRVVVVFDTSAGPVELTVTMTAVEPGDPLEWKIDPAGRRVVDSLTRLRAQPREIQPGSTVAGYALITPGLTLWTLNDGFAARREGDAEWERVEAVVLAFFRVPDDGAEVGEAELRARASARAVLSGLDLGYQDEGVTDRLRVFRVYAVATMGMTRFSREGLGKIAERWATMGDVVPVDGRWRGILAPATEASGIDLFAKGAQAALVVIDDRRVLRGVVRLDDRADDEVLDALRALMVEDQRGLIAPTDDDPG